MNEEIEKVCTWIKNYVAKANKSGVVLGLSGGIDSAVVAYLCVKALGKANVHGVALPCNSKQEDAKDAELIAKSLEISFKVIGLGDALDAEEKALSTLVSKISALTKGNIKARLRMITLYALGETYDSLVAGTCNKSEIAIGYFTKYGDGGSDFEPIGEFYKDEVFEMARVLGIPEKIINRVPTAGLWDGQTDESEMGVTYKELDAILRAMLDGEELPEDIDKAKVKRVAQLSNSSEHKRTTPPIYQRDSKNFE